MWSCMRLSRALACFSLVIVLAGCTGLSDPGCRRALDVVTNGVVAFTEGYGPWTPETLPGIGPYDTVEEYVAGGVQHILWRCGLRETEPDYEAYAR